MRHAARRSSTCDDTYNARVCETFRRLGWCETSATIRDNCRGSCDNCMTCSGTGNVVCLQRASSEEGASLMCPADAAGGDAPSAGPTTVPSLPGEGRSGSVNDRVIGDTSGGNGSDDREASAQTITLSVALALGGVAALVVTRRRRKLRANVGISEDGSDGVFGADRLHSRSASQGSSELFTWSGSAASSTLEPMDWDDLLPDSFQVDINPGRRGMFNPSGHFKAGNKVHLYDIVGHGRHPLPLPPDASRDGPEVNIGRNSSKRASVLVGQVQRGVDC